MEQVYAILPSVALRKLNGGHCRGDISHLSSLIVIASHCFRNNGFTVLEHHPSKLK